MDINMVLNKCKSSKSLDNESKIVIGHSWNLEKARKLVQNCSGNFLRGR